jgi:transcriptional antiterminator RfaH
MSADMSWYVARVRRAYIAMVGLCDQGFEVYYPKRCIVRPRAGRMHEFEEAIFPGYMFVYLPVDRGAWRAVNGTRGVAKLIATGEEGVPLKLPRGEVERLQDRERAGEFKIRYPRRLRVGDQVIFKHGALFGQIGIIERTKRERISVLLQVLGGLKVDAPRDWLRVAAATG